MPSSFLHGCHEDTDAAMDLAAATGVEMPCLQCLLQDWVRMAVYSLECSVKDLLTDLTSLAKQDLWLRRTRLRQQAQHSVGGRPGLQNKVWCTMDAVLSSCRVICKASMHADAARRNAAVPTWATVLRSRSSKGDKAKRPASCLVFKQRKLPRRRLPPREPVTSVAASSIQGLDSRAVAALLKELAKTGQGARAHEFFEYILGLGDQHEAARLCDVFTYTAAISICNNDQQVRRALPSPFSVAQCLWVTAP